MNTPSDFSSGNLLQRAGFWVALTAFVVVLFLPTPTELPIAAKHLLAVTALMTILWVTQAIPIAATSLIPIAIYPFLGITSADDVAASYMNDSILLYLGGFMLAIAIERWGLHRRWALHTVRVLGTGPKRLLLGFMTATALISMWISNTATTLMMLPIGLALMSAFEACLEENSQGSSSLPLVKQRLSSLGAAIPLGIAYAASCGGIGTLVGSPTNLVFRRIWNQTGDPVSAAEWMMCCMPIAILMTFFAWLLLSLTLGPIPGSERVGRRFFKERVLQLGAPSREEWCVAVIFIATALLWVLRRSLEFGDSVHIPGWGPYVTTWMVQGIGVDAAVIDRFVSDTTVAMLATVLLFILPARHDSEGQRRRLLDWETVERRLPWGIILLFGGGFAMADAFSATGLSEWLGRQLTPLGNLPTIALIGCVCIMVTFLTEFTSNVATTTTLLPILMSLAATLNLDARLLMLPATVTASCAFMLPVATPPNAIAFSSGQVTMGQMVKVGFWLNLIGVGVVTLVTSQLLGPVFGIKW